MITITKALPSREQLLTLYDSVGWSAYTCEPDRLERAVAASLSVFTAWDGSHLVGLLRAVGDGETILYIQDLLVAPAWQRQGIGRRLMEACLDTYPHVRQKVLLTDHTEGNLAFYRACGFVPSGDYDCTVFLRLENIP